MMTTYGLRAALLVGCALGGLMSVGGARAEAPVAGASAVSEIVVTATKRSESIEKVPVSVSAYSQAKMDQAGVRSINDLAALTPGLNFSTNNFTGTAGSNIDIRGVQSRVGASTTGVYVDDTPIQSRGSFQNFAGNAYPLVFDLERVEVLRGPQGTLFGSGSEGGTVRFITPEPNLYHFGGYARAEASDTLDAASSYEAGLAVGGPVVEGKIGFRASAWYRKDGGYIDRVDPATGAAVSANSNSRDSSAVKLAMAFKPLEALTITPSIYYQDVYAHDASAFFVDLSNADKGVFRSGRVLAQPSEDRFVLPSVKLAADLGAVQLNATTSYFYRDDWNHNDYTNFQNALFSLLGAPNPYTTPGAGARENPFAPAGETALTQDYVRQHVLTQEIRLSSKNDASRLTWVAGLFYSDAREQDAEYVSGASLGQYLANQLNTVLPPFLQQTAASAIPFIFGAGQGLVDGEWAYTGSTHNYDTQIAGFGEASYKISDKLKATVGMRVAHDQFRYVETLGGPFNGGSSVSTGSKTDTPFTPKMSLSYQADPHDLYYLTVAEGYRVGGANARLPSPCSSGQPGTLPTYGLTNADAPSTYAPDNLWSYEGGWKGRLVGGRLKVDASGYHIMWNNIQQQVYLTGCGLGYTANLGRATSDGFDLSLQAQVTDDLKLGLQVGYTNTTYGETVLIGSKGYVLVEKGEVVGEQGLAAIPPTPPWSVVLSGEYDFTVLGGRKAYLWAQDAYKSTNDGRYGNEDASSISYDPALPRNPQLNIFKLRAGVNWSGTDLSVFADNVFNTHPSLNVQHDVLGASQYYAVTVRPLTVGLTATKRF